jgi:hypothetical protein
MHEDRAGATAVQRASVPRWKEYFHKLIAVEISALTRYYDAVLQWGRAPGDNGYLLEFVESGGDKRLIEYDAELPDLTGERDRRTAVLMVGTINHDYDIQTLFAKLRSRMSRTSRVVMVAYNPYLNWLYAFGLKLGLKAGVMPTTFITWTDLDNICRLAGFERVRARPCVYFPWKLLGLGALINKLMPAVPWIRSFSLTTVIVVRPVMPESGPVSISIVIPARNERGNIAPALERIPALAGPVEVIFVEGHSSDGTWEEIERARQAYAGPCSIQSMRQTGKGKADAVRLGFSRASGDLLTILDADLTMPPELLPRFVDAWREGRADFINGSRIVYSMEGEAMRFLNRLGNVFFAKALSSVLGVRLGDVLCGTKLVARHDYARMVRWRGDFGDFDPFGDFELIFPAAILAIGTVDVPIRYRARTYGSTNINRFRHGVMLLKMTMIGFFRLKLGRLP